MLSSKAKVYQDQQNGEWFAMGEHKSKPMVYRFDIQADEWFTTSLNPAEYERRLKSGRLQDIGERAGAL